MYRGNLALIAFFKHTETEVGQVLYVDSSWF